jgi:RNA polymerase sigma-70 factor (ECF subfamily)
MYFAELNVMRLVRLDPSPVERVDAPGSSPPAGETRAAFDALVREHEPALRAFAMRLCGSDADARDLVQDTHERALRRFDTFTRGTNARAWLFTILHRGFLDACRRRAAERRVDSLDEVDVAAPETAEVPVWTSVSPEQLAQAIAALDDEFRSVYQMHAIQSLSYQQISERLGLPLNTVGTRLSRARRKLRAMLEAAVGSEVGT